MKYLVDSSAWIEYLRGSSAGKKVHDILEGDNSVIVIPIIISEVIGKVKRDNQNIEIAYDSIINNAKIVELTPKLAKEAGILYTDLRKKESSVSLIDSLIICMAQSTASEIVTKDTHFKHAKNVLFI